MCGRQARQIWREARERSAYKALVDEAFLNYGAHHFDHYDILLASPTSWAASVWSITVPAKTRCSPSR
jgi:hypothetical protein